MQPLCDDSRQAIEVNQSNQIRYFIQLFYGIASLKTSYRCIFDCFETKNHPHIGPRLLSIHRIGAECHTYQRQRFLARIHEEL